MAHYVFLDTEFAPANATHAAVLLSVGLCSMESEEFYRELAVKLGDDRNDEFIRTHVLSQLKAASVHVASFAEVGEQLAHWLGTLGFGELQVCYDYHQDCAFVEELLAAGRGGSDVAVVPVNMGYFLGEPEWERAAQRCFDELLRRRRLRPHHALADAYALRAKSLAAHGA